MRLLKFVTGFAVGGTERHVVNLCRRLDRASFDFQLGCMSRSGDMLKEFTALGINISEYPVRNLYGPASLWQRLRFARELSRQRIGIVHSYNFHANVFAIPAARLARTPVVVASIRDTGSHLTSAKRRAQRHVCRFADHVLVNANAILTQLVQDGFTESKISVVHNGVDVNQFAGRRTDARSLLRRELSLPANDRLVGMLTRLDPVKRVEDFITAAALVAARAARVRFIVIGAHSFGRSITTESLYKERLLRQVDRLGLTDRVIFLGTRLDASRLLSDIAVSVLPSATEGLSNTILESMAAGIPVVATAVGGTPEIIDDGSTGLLVPPREPSTLAGAILRLLEQPELATRLGRAGRDKVARRFTVEKMVAETERIYERLFEKQMSRSYAN